MHPIYTVTVFLLALTGSTPKPESSSTGTGNMITSLDVRNDGRFLIGLMFPNAPTPGCVLVGGASQSTDRLSGNANTVGGQALLQLAIALYTSGRKVTVDGNDACIEYPGIESIARIVGH